MKKLLTIYVLVFVLPVSVFPGGGVDVGNGSKILPYYTNDFNSELDLQNALEKLKVSIDQLGDIRVASVYAQGECTKEVEIIETQQIQKYNISNKTIDHEKKYKGKLSLLFKKCNRDELLPDQIGKHY